MTKKTQSRIMVEEIISKTEEKEVIINSHHDWLIRLYWCNGERRSMSIQGTRERGSSIRPWYYGFCSLPDMIDMRDALTTSIDIMRLNDVESNS